MKSWNVIKLETRSLISRDVFKTDYPFFLRRRKERSDRIRIYISRSVRFGPVPEKGTDHDVCREK